MDQEVAQSPTILSAQALRARRDEFVALLRDAVEGNASVGFVRPLAESSLQAFWDDIAAEVEAGERSAASSLYRRSGWTAFGTVPDYACDPDGTPAGCVFFYKRLD